MTPSGIPTAMGDLGTDTAIEALGEGRFSASLSPEWEIWGPMGGYVAAIALRAAGATSPFPAPVAGSGLRVDASSRTGAGQALYRRVPVPDSEQTQGGVDG